MNNQGRADDKPPQRPVKNPSILNEAPGISPPSFFPSFVVVNLLQIPIHRACLGA